ncbi:MAG TPA: hypothetical protein VGM92_10380, partial [Candidatus Kapabacteria bacterium]
VSKDLRGVKRMDISADATIEDIEKRLNAGTSREEDIALLDNYIFDIRKSVFGEEQGKPSRRADADRIAQLEVAILHANKRANELEQAARRAEINDGAALNIQSEALRISINRAGVSLDSIRETFMRDSSNNSAYPEYMAAKLLSERVFCAIYGIS